MGTELDIDDVAAQNPKAIEELAALRNGFERYETARRMNPRAWSEAWMLNIATGKPFDEIIDDLRPFVAPNVKLRGCALLRSPS